MEPKYHSRDALAARRETLEREALRLSERIAMLDELPEEPVFEDGEPSVIWFQRKFGRASSNSYTYAAVRTANGKWYTTGPTSPKGYSWDALIQWIREFDETTEVWTATEWSEL